MKKTYVLEHKMVTLENEVQIFKNVTRKITELKNQETQIDVEASNVGMDKKIEV